MKKTKALSEIEKKKKNNKEDKKIKSGKKKC